MSKKNPLVKRYYHTWYNREQLWSLEKVRNAVISRSITAKEFQEITGTVFDSV